IPWLLGWDEPGLMFNVGVHLGTLMAVVIYFRRDLFAMSLALPRGIIKREPLRDRMSFLALIILVGSIPAAIVAFTLGDRIERFFHSGEGGTTAIFLIAVALMALGLLMALAERVADQRRPI